VLLPEALLWLSPAVPITQEMTLAPIATALARFTG
jgi:hypothetical protein